MTASDDRTARVWDATTAAEISALCGHEDLVSSAVFSPDGTRALTIAHRTVRLWDATTGTEIIRFALDAPVTAMDIREDVIALGDSLGEFTPLRLRNFCGGYPHD